MRDAGADLAHVLDSLAFLIFSLVRARSHRRNPLRHPAQPARRCLRQMLFEPADDRSSDEADRSGAGGRTEARVARGTVTYATVHVEQLPPVAQKPVVVEGEEAGN